MTYFSCIQHTRACEVNHVKPAEGMYIFFPRTYPDLAAAENSKRRGHWLRYNRI